MLVFWYPWIELLETFRRKQIYRLNEDRIIGKVKRNDNKKGNEQYDF